ncbi:hypothetical protein HJC23_007845 [Cyclotella cryptica]|uniref:Uncharacterized protein n=1 Tax=Cyclotella cryptica TaxID=29204 RepID=A0ABD3QZW0_9STRA|eukprot:CCRYP_000160-RA/>CCRYP_000160-RA protein AED:0.41 eAED:0.41 QI:232/1/1/1/1/1/2/310/177
MKIAICTLASAVAITNAQLLSLTRLRSSASRVEWGRQQPRRVQAQRVLEASMSLSMSMDFDSSISIPSFDDSSLSISVSMSVESDVEVPDEPDIIVDGGVPVVIVVPAPADSEEDSESDIMEESDESYDDNVEAKGDEEDFVDGDFKEQKLEASTATSTIVSSALATLLAFAFINMV